MKKYSLVVLFLAFLLIALPAVSSGDLDKVDAKVLQAAASEDTVRVIVKLREDAGFGTASAKENKLKNLEKDVGKSDFKVKRKNLRGEYFAAYVTPKGLEKLAKDPNIEAIHYDHKFSAALQDSVGLINASTVQNLQMASGAKVNGTNRQNSA